MVTSHMQKEQIVVAQEKYSDLIFDGRSKLTITLGGVNFEVIIPPDYPTTPPKILKDGVEISTPLLENWIPSFRIVDVVEQCEKCAAGKAVPHFEPTAEEVMHAISYRSTDELKQDHVKEEIVANLETLKKARAAERKARDEVKAAEAGMADFETGLVANLRDLEINEQEVKRLRARYEEECANPAERVMRSMRLKLEQLQKEKEDGGALDAAKERHEKGEIGFEEYLRIVFDEQKKKQAAAVLGDFIESQLPR